MVGLVAILEILGRNTYSKLEIAEKACEIEIEKCGFKIGYQDQYMCALGGFNYLEFRPDGKLVAQALPVKNVNKILEKSVLVRVGASRLASDILADQGNAIRSNDSVLAGTLRLAELAEIGRDLFMSDDFNENEYHLLMNEAWETKKSQSNLISNHEIEELVRILSEKGAKSVKLLGAGGAGFLLATFDESRQIECLPAELRYIRPEIDLAGNTVKFFG